MASLVSALDTEFTPAVGDFNVSVTTMPAHLLRKNSSGTAFAAVTPNEFTGAMVCQNPVAGAVYKFISKYGISVVQADQ
jgi:hypothetical protein